MRELEFPELVAAYLQELGEHVYDVAKNLERRGIRGGRRSGRECPIARYLTSRPGIEECIVSAGHAYSPLAQSIAWLPYQVGVFIKCFDFGFFPDLLDPTVG